MTTVSLDGLVVAATPRGNVWSYPDLHGDITATADGTGVLTGSSTTPTANPSTPPPASQSPPTHPSPTQMADQEETPQFGGRFWFIRNIRSFWQRRRNDSSNDR